MFRSPSVYSLRAIGRRARLVFAASLVIAALAMPMSAQAQVCVVADAGGTAVMPPECQPEGYASPNDVHMIIDGLPPGTTIELDASHQEFGQIMTMPGGNLGGEIEQFQSVIILNMQGTGDLNGFSRTVVLGGVPVETHIGPRNLGDPVQSFDTEIVSMQGQLFGDPDFDLLTIRAGSNFGLPSPGQTTLTRLGPPGSDWAVDSFFDIEYEIDFQGAPGSILEGLSGTTQGQLTMQAGGPSGIPAVSDWGIATMALLTLIGGTLVFRRQAAIA